MGAVYDLRIPIILFLIALMVDGGVVTQKCLEPLKCIPFPECSGGDQRGDDIVFICERSRRDDDRVCCLPPPPTDPVHDTSGHPGWKPNEAESKAPEQIPVSGRGTEDPIIPDPDPPGWTNSRDGATYRSNGTADSRNRSHITVYPSHGGSESSRHSADGSSKRISTPAILPDSTVAREHVTSNNSSTPSSGAATGCCSQGVNQKMKLLPQEGCGLSTSNRITNGQDASFGQFPWMALLGYRLRDGTVSFLCGGTLINRRYILTAAHCLEPEGAVLEVVRLGEHNLATEPDCDQMLHYCADPVVDVPVETAIRHEMFNSPYLKNDIALLRLQVPINMTTEYIRPICLPFGLNVTGLEEKKYHIAGWGKTDYYDSDGSPVLQFTGILSMPLPDCDSRQEKEVRPLDHTQLCAGVDMGKDACKGDSGGPLMETLQAPARSSVQTFQIGVVSFGSVPCGAKYSPSVYTRVTAYLGWILDNIAP
ncbi:phenoloxidase-activating factor 3-like [Bacillus rossius redtenbacheri]|uniref:phenoloxidase-activating factor 3-like n=1 Tax=Bacillus rossius redtenbacheri TaxID=93214 RepID=UPI002FDC8BCF